MIVYNVTVKIDINVHDEWYRWMKNEHIPDVMETKLFTANKMYRLLEEDESDGITYSIQYFAESFSNYMSYKQKHAERLQQSHQDKFKNQYTAFRSLMRDA